MDNHNKKIFSTPSKIGIRDTQKCPQMRNTDGQNPHKIAPHHLLTKEMQIKKVMIYCLTTQRLAHLKK